MSRELPKAYEPGAVEQKQYEFWREGGYFTPEVESDRPTYTITIPPPNVTGELHLGHALQSCIHDVLIRRKRMQGFKTLCLPGTDHAGISTNIKVEQTIRAEGKDRWEVGREGFVQRAREWTLKYGGAILNQLQALGCSYDWTRTRFTLDEFVEEGPHTANWALGKLYTQSGYARAVLTSFVRFHERGWLYRAERIVNWCPLCQTTLSELELEYRDVPSHLWYLRYPGAGGPEGAIGEGVVVATTRPETMLGDTGVAVSPSDERYRHLVGQRVILPLMDRPVPVVADEHVDAAFGTGAVKVTPAHDPNDWDIAQRHPELQPAIMVIGTDGLMTERAGPYAGLPSLEARKRVVADLEARGLLVKVEDYTHSVAHHDKCGTVIEPLLKLQWWADCRELAQKARAAIDSKRVTFVPERFSRMATDWLDTIRPWNVSRQLWWGHRIPFYYCRRCDAQHLVFGHPAGSQEEELIDVLEGVQPIASVDPPGATAHPPGAAAHPQDGLPGDGRRCPRCGGDDLVQDPDVLDTWFSSALWPFATLGWPRETMDLQTFYPTDLMITGRDIIYLWVARMIMTGEEFLGKEPFKDVLIHATVTDEDGRRMSKSLGTGFDPMELIGLYGADATRFGLTSLVTQMQDIRFKVRWQSGGKRATSPDDHVAKAEQIEEARNFCNKLWNISRFVLMNLGDEPVALRPLDSFAGSELELADCWILSRFAATIAAVNEAVDRYALGEAAWTLYHFLWDEFADWYVELAKPRLRGEQPRVVREVLLAVLEASLRLAHPFLPFITEEIWQSLPIAAPAAGTRALIVAPYPSALPSLLDAEAERRMERVIEVVRTIRNLKAELGIPVQTVDVYVSPGELERPYVELTARARIAHQPPEGPAVRATAAGMELALAVDGAIDLEVERARLLKEQDRLQRELQKIAAQLANEQFVARAPAAVVERQRTTQEELRAQLAKVEERRQLFGA